MTIIKAAEAKGTPLESHAVQGRKQPARSMGNKAVKVGINPPGSELAEKLARASVSERIAIEMSGVPAPLAKGLFTSLQIPTAEVHELIGMARTSLQRRLAASDGVIDGMPGQTVVGYADLLNILDRLLAEFGSEDAASRGQFRAGTWLGRWLREPHPALGGVPPATYMRAPSGRTAVTRVLGAAFSGAYQ